MTVSMKGQNADTQGSTMPRPGRTFQSQLSRRPWPLSAQQKRTKISCERLEAKCCANCGGWVGARQPGDALLALQPRSHENLHEIRRPRQVRHARVDRIRPSPQSLPCSGGADQERQRLSSHNTRQGRAQGRRVRSPTWSAESAEGPAPPAATDPSATFCRNACAATAASRNRSLRRPLRKKQTEGRAA